MSDLGRQLDPMARAIFNAALNEGRAGELLEILFEGGSATVDTRGKLVTASAADLIAMVDGSSGAWITDAACGFRPPDNLAPEHDQWVCPDGHLYLWRHKDARRV